MNNLRSLQYRILFLLVTLGKLITTIDYNIYSSVHTGSQERDSDVLVLFCVFVIYLIIIV